MELILATLMHTTFLNVLRSGQTLLHIWLVLELPFYPEMVIGESLTSCFSETHFGSFLNQVTTIFCLGGEENRVYVLCSMY